MSYRDRTTRRLTLPSGATILVRKLAVGDFQSVGKIPGTLPESDRARLREAAADKLTPADLDFMVKTTTVILTRCCGPLEFEGQALRIVDKPFTDCAADELSLELLEQEDANAIVKEVTALSGLSKEAAAEARPFRPQPGLDADPSPGGEALRAAA